MSITYRQDVDYEYSYNICTVADEDVFRKQCNALENNIPNLIHVESITDVDGSKTQIYRKDDLQLIVHNSYYLNSVYIESEFDIDKYFE